MAIKCLAAFLTIVSAYLGWWVASTSSFMWLIPAVLSLVTGVGLWLSKRWSVYLWHSLAVVVSLAWLISIIRIALAGWPYRDALTSFIALIPGFLVLALCATGSFVVEKHFGGGKYAL